MMSLDYNKVRKSFDRAAETYDAAAVLQREVADRLMQRLDYILLEPSAVLDLGCGTGYLTDKLLRRWKKSQVIASDLSVRMCQKSQQTGNLLRRPNVVCADARALPFKSNSLDLVASNLMLQWCDDLKPTFADINRVLTEQGVLFFSTFGPDTLIELKQAWQAVDSDVHIHEFADMHDVADQMLAAGLVQPVVDMEKITLTYTSVNKLLKDLKMIGANNASPSRKRGLTGKQTLAALQQAYEPMRTADGLYPLSYEVIYGHGWSGRNVEQALGGKTVIPVKEIQKPR